MRRQRTSLPSRANFGDGKRDVGDEHALDGGVGGGVDEHDGLRERAVLVEGRTELEEFVVLEAHAADDDHVGIRLEGDAREQFVVGSPARAKIGSFCETTSELKRSIIGMFVRTMRLGMMRLAGLTEGWPIGIWFSVIAGRRRGARPCR